MSRRKKWLKRGGWTLAVLVLLLFLLFLFRVSILRAIGDHLIVEDPPGEGEVLFVLGGNSLDRGRKAAAIHKKGRVSEVVCLGANVPGVLRVFDIDSSESEITARIVEGEGVPEDRVKVLEKGESTLEEAYACLDHCKKEGVDTAIVLSDKFHLRRVRSVFEPAFRNDSTFLRFRGVSSSRYDESQWWRSEEGMLMVNNEYMKLLYYAFAKEVDPPEEKGAKTD